MKRLTQSIKTKCEGLSQNNRRKVLLGLFMLYAVCAIWTILQGFKQYRESAEHQQMQQIGSQNLQIKHLVEKKDKNQKIKDNETNNNTKNSTQTATD